jgi:Lysozyme inhibitor LprI
MILAASPALAQLALPGAVPPSAIGTIVKVPGPKKAPKAAASYAPPGVETLVGRPLLLNGVAGALQFSGRADALKVDKLTMLGEVISDPSRQCRIDVVAGTAIDTRSLGRPDGLLRFAVDIPACPFELDVLDGAALVPPQLRACVFKEADCQASPSGLWGPAGAALGGEVKAIDQARGRGEAAMNANYRALSERLNDPTKANDLAREQSRFSQERQDICHDYVRESAHNFCATRLTDARAAFLKARFDEAAPVAEKGQPVNPAKIKRKRKLPPQ